MWMIYGANGYTGELIAREAARRGMRPVLAGRRRETIEPLARELQCEFRVFDLAHPDLKDVELVLHCAGPFSQTSTPMIRACLDAGAHYLDITGEISVFESIMRMNDEAQRRGVSLLPGVGFDVVPTDCLAAQLAQKLPGADELWLAFYSARGGISRGTMKTMIEGIDQGGAIRRDGKIVRVPMLYDVREIPFSCGPRLAMTIPWGDVSTAFHSTGIRNIRVYNAASPRAIRRLRFIRPCLPIMGLKPIKRLLHKFVDRRGGPSAEVRTEGRMYVWGRVVRGSEEVTMTLTTPEGYAFTVMSSIAAVERVLAGPRRGGSFTPSKFFGATFVNEIVDTDPARC
jgi:short subunit dehydrogenase-like uncharacterized protein